jgi:hypothetical protein
MSSTATFNDHIVKVIETASDLSSWIFRSFKTRSKVLMLQLWKSIVIPRLDYCSQLWNPHQNYLIKQREDIQKFFVRNIAGFRHKSYASALQELGLYSLQRRRERYQIIYYLWSIIEGITPNIETPNGILVDTQSNVSARLGRKIKTRPIRHSPRFDIIHYPIMEPGYLIVSPNPSAILKIVPKSPSKIALIHTCLKFLTNH